MEENKTENNTIQNNAQVNNAVQNTADQSNTVQNNVEQNNTVQNNTQSLPNDFFKSTADGESIENTSSNLFTVSEDVNPLTTDVNKINQAANSSGVIGGKEKPPRKKFFVSNKSIFNEGMEKNEYLSLYVGKNYSKIASHVINYAAVIFCPFYYMFRKMFVFGILIFVGLLFVHLRFNNYLYDLGYYLVFGFIFNMLYLAKSQRRVNKIRAKNGEFDEYTISRLCSKSGGRSVVLLILGILLSIIIFAYFCANFYLVPMTEFLEKFGIVFKYDNGNMYFDYDKTLINTDEILDDKPGYYIVKSNAKAKDYLKMGQPNSHFIDVSEGDNITYYYTLGNDSLFETCRVELYGIKGYSSPDKFIEAVQKERNEDVFEKNVNGIDWKYIHHESLKGTNYFYVTMIDYEIFLVNYYRNNTGIYDCMFYEEDVLKSIKKK